MVTQYCQELSCSFLIQEYFEYFIKHSVRVCIYLRKFLYTYTHMYHSYVHLNLHFLYPSESFMITMSFYIFTLY